MIAIINYEGGNASSVANALLAIEELSGRRYGVRLVERPAELQQAKLIILPGVGAAPATLRSLAALGLREALEEKVRGEKTPFIGICIGYQLLFSHTEEGAAGKAPDASTTACFNWLAGAVKKFPESGPASGGEKTPRLRVPQMGWNEVRFLKQDTPLTKGLGASAHFYFVNSYFCNPQESAFAFGETGYGEKFCSMVVAENLAGTQFHLEKSGAAGLRLFSNLLTHYLET